MNSDYDYSDSSCSEDETIKKLPEITDDIIADIHYELHNYCQLHNLPFLNVPTYKFNPIL
jgi:hypothetical protein